MICRNLERFPPKHRRFAPLPYQPENNDIPVQTPPTGFDALRTLAVSRIYLDNFDHITAYWVGLGMKLAQVALSYGADDLHGTIIEEHIFHMAGATSPSRWLPPRQVLTSPVTFSCREASFRTAMPEWF